MTGATRQWLLLATRLVVGAVWTWVGLTTLTDPLGGPRAVRLSDLLPDPLVEPVGSALPAVELVIGLALLLGVMTRGAALISVVLLAALVVAAASAWTGGPGIVRDLALLLASALVVRAGPGRLALDPALSRRRTTTAPDPDPDPDTTQHLEGVD